MHPIRESVRTYIRRLYFTGRLSFLEIGERLGMSVENVRAAIVLDGGLAPAASAPPPPAGNPNPGERP